MTVQRSSRKRSVDTLIDDGSAQVPEGTSIRARLSTRLDRMGHRHLRHFAVTAELVDNEDESLREQVGWIGGWEANLLEGYDDVLEECDDESGHLLHLLSSAHQILGVSGSGKAILIEHFALEPTFRGKGIGPRLLAQALHYWGEQAGPTCVIAQLHVENPESMSEEVYAHSLARLREIAEGFGFATIDETDDVMALDASGWDGTEPDLMLGWLE